MEIDISFFGKDDVDLNRIAELYCKTFIGEKFTPKDLESTVENINKHACYEGFKGIKAIDDIGKLQGFTYGYTSLPHQFYRKKLGVQLTDQQNAKWLKDYFEFVELAVDSSARRMGIGGLLHDKLLDGLDQQTSILTTSVDNDPAIKLYMGKGWEIISGKAPVISEADPQVIMGKVL
ncbi:GNAT family N-acetyltransferase [Virgibacillus doumboii]|uniref:GNAT family N-acetyltransferase n=1 Tax=Virgibacillus doumboii TaxID=2697503 RepID=UPI0013DEB2CF|nr:GNAT family N-acetyltransferase [Virgibacillus doumboii]